MAYEKNYTSHAAYAPVVGKQAHLKRKKLLGTLIRARNKGNRLFLIEGEAGQGKSTLVAHHMEEMAQPFIWYSTESADQDVTRFIRNLLARLKENLGGFSSPHLEKILSRGEVSPLNGYTYGQMLAHSLTAFSVSLVFDDLHFLNTSPWSSSVLKGLCRESSPAQFFFLISRYPIIPHLFEGQRPARTTHIHRDDLTMSHSEVAHCLRALFDLAPDRKTVSHIHKITEGWCMGVLAKAHTLQVKGEAAALTSPPELEIRSYLTHEILETCFPSENLPSLSDLSWCNTIPMELARVVTGQNDINTLFGWLSRHNLFTRFTNPTQNEAIFHPYLRYCLRERNQTLRSKEQKRHLFTTMAAWYEQNDAPEEAVRFYIKAENHDAVERLIRKTGILFWNTERLEVLRESVDTIPEDVILERGWLACNYGISLVEISPKRALKYLEAAQTCFQDRNDPLGLLVSRIKLIYFHTWVDALFDAGRPLLEPVHQAIRERHDTLDNQILIKALTCLASGYTFFDSNLPQAAACAEQGLQLALKGNFHNAACEIRIIRCYIHGFKGDWRRIHIELEPLIPLLTSSKINTYTRVIGWLTLVNVLVLEGDFDNYRHYRNISFSLIHNELLLHSIAHPFLHLWDIDAALAKGNIDLAENISNEALALPQAGLSPHIRSLFLQYHAFVLALQKKQAKIPDICQEALVLRLKAGSPYFSGLSRMVAGGALAFSQHYEMAQTLLQKARLCFESMQETFQLSATLAHLGHLYWKTGQTEPAKACTEKWLRLMKRERYHHHYSWSPQICRTLLDRAMAEGIEVDTARALAAQKLNRGYSEKAKPIALLKITTFGGFSLSTGEESDLTPKDLTPAQQRLLVLLITRRNQVLSIDEIQTQFWPDVSPKKGRARLDTLVSRLKKTLKKVLSPVDPSAYLSIRKEKLLLENTMVDLWEYMKGLKKGLNAHRSKCHWQATNAFRSAFTLASGPCLTDLSDDGPGHEFREYTLAPLSLKAAKAWVQASLHLKLPLFEDLDLMKREISNDSESLDLVRGIYDLYIAADAPHRAEQLLRYYSAKLSSGGMPPSEIEMLLENFWNQ